MQVDGDDGACGPESFAGFWINRASRLIVRRTDARLREYGLAMSHLPVLRALAAGTPLSQTELARIAGVEQPSMAETVTRMERDGVVRRETNPSDKRATLIALTRRARTRFGKAMNVLREAEREAMAGLSPHETSLLRKLLERVAKNVEASLERAADEEDAASAPFRKNQSRAGEERPKRRRRRT